MCCACFGLGMHTQSEECCPKYAKIFLVGQKRPKSKNKYVFTAKFDRDRGSKSDLTNTFMSK